MAFIGGTNWVFNRNEIYSQPDNLEGNRNEAFKPAPKQELVQIQQLIPDSFIDGTKLGPIVDTGNAGITSIGNQDSDIRGWAGSSYADRATAPFRYDQAGNFWATSAVISGSITATSGAIGGFNLGATTLTATSGGNSTVISSGATAFAAGPTGSPSVKITQAGVLTASGAIIDGYVVKKPGTFGGDGSDGVVADANLTITGSNNTIITKNYSSWTAGSVARTLTITPTGCILIIKIAGNADFTNWTMDFVGKGAAKGTGGTAVVNPGGNSTGNAGTNGTNGVSALITTGKGGGAPAEPGFNQVGVGGSTTATSPTALVTYMQGAKMILAAPGAGGGGGASGNCAAAPNSSGAGGDGGAGGGCVIFEIGGNVTFSSTTATVAGAAGSNGGNASGTDAAGGGAGSGGGGGTFILLYNGTLTGTLTPTISGGVGGTGGTGVGGFNRGAGGSGASGGSLEANGTAGVNGGANTGANGVAGATGAYLIEKNVSWA